MEAEVEVVACCRLVGESQGMSSLVIEVQVRCLTGYLLMSSMPGRSSIRVGHIEHPNHGLFSRCVRTRGKLTLVLQEVMHILLHTLLQRPKMRLEQIPRLPAQREEPRERLDRLVVHVFVPSTPQRVIEDVSAIRRVPVQPAADVLPEPVAEEVQRHPAEHVALVRGSLDG